MRRQISPRTIIDSPKGERQYLHKLAVRQGENREDSASFTHVFYHTFPSLSSAFLKFLKKFYFRFLSRILSLFCALYDRTYDIAKKP